MKKRNYYFIFAFTFSLLIGYYARLSLFDQEIAKDQNIPTWKTYVKKSDEIISSYNSTEEELISAKIPFIKKSKDSYHTKAFKHNLRTPASDLKIKSINQMRGNRILLGNTNAKYEDANYYLKMKNKINPKWRELMGEGLMRFQSSTTKLLVKEESSLIKIEGDDVAPEGQFLEEVKVTYLMANGDKRSFSALIDSETGTVVETWNRTLEEKIDRNKKPIFSFSTQNENGITAHE